MKILIAFVLAALCAGCARGPVKPDAAFSNPRIIERDLSGQMAAKHQENN